MWPTEHKVKKVGAVFHVYRCFFWIDLIAVQIYNGINDFCVQLLFKTRAAIAFYYAFLLTNPLLLCIILDLQGGFKFTFDKDCIVMSFVAEQLQYML